MPATTATLFLLQDLEVAPARVELRAARLQLGGHAVEGGDERTDLIVALARDALVDCVQLRTAK